MSDPAITLLAVTGDNRIVFSVIRALQRNQTTCRYERTVQPREKGSHTIHGTATFRKSEEVTPIPFAIQVVQIASGLHCQNTWTLTTGNIASSRRFKIDPVKRTITLSRWKGHYSRDAKQRTVQSVVNAITAILAAPSPEALNKVVTPRRARSPRSYNDWPRGTSVRGNWVREHEASPVPATAG